MIRVIAADMDGTLLNEKHELSEFTYRTILKVQEKGIRFMIATGRDHTGAAGVLGKTPLICDWITGSGAEIRSPQGKVLRRIAMDPSCFREIYDKAKQLGLNPRFCAGGVDYIVGNREETEQRLLEESRLFFGNGSDEELRNSALFQQLLGRMRNIKSLNELFEKEIEVYKIFIAAKDGEIIRKMWEEVERIPHIATASSFFNNLELTDIRAQKGTALTEYTKSLGYKKEEVMVLGDSLNDLSMFQAGFGAAVAMGNADAAIRKNAEYVTKTNSEDGAAYAMQMLLEGRLSSLKK